MLSRETGIFCGFGEELWPESIKRRNNVAGIGRTFSLLAVEEYPGFEQFFGCTQGLGQRSMFEVVTRNEW